MKLSIITANTPVGDFHMFVDEKDVVRTSGFGSIKNLKKRLPKEIQSDKFVEIKNHPYKTAVARYFKGDKKALATISAKQEGGKFSQNVWRAMSKVKQGSVVSYKDLAKAAGSPAAVRAVGTVCAENHLVLLVPCHRIIRSDGKIGNYFYGTNLKKKLLEIEN